MNSPVRKYRLARDAIAFVVAMTVVNALFHFTNMGKYYLCSIFVTRILYTGEFGTVGIILALAILAVYGIAWYLSERKSGWMIAALVLFCVDTLCVSGTMVIIRQVGNGTAVFNMAIELIAHIAVIVFLILGVANRDIGVMTDEQINEVNPLAARIEGKPDFARLAPEIDCSIMVAESGKRNSMPSRGVIRFEPKQLVVGSVGMGAQVLIGSGLASNKERVRVDYSEIAEVVFMNKKATNLQIKLKNGTMITASLYKTAERDRFLAQMSEHGVTLPPLQNR